MENKYVDLLIKNGIFGRADACSIEDDYLIREAYENALFAGDIDLDETSGLSEHEYMVKKNVAEMNKLEEIRTERTDRKADNERRGEEMAEAIKKENELEFLDLRSTNIIRVDGVTIRLSKHVKWNKDRRGVIDKSFLNVEIVGSKKTIKLLAGAKGSNVWCGVKNVLEKDEVPEEVELTF